MVKKTVVYEIWAPSWKNLAAIIQHLRRIARLGVTHVWFSGILESPWYDHGYDISNYCRIDPRFVNFKRGDVMEEFNELVRATHLLGMKVIIDLVLNHTSTEHSWFRNHPERYCWNDEDRPDWKNLFDNGSAWEYSKKHKMYYLHLFHKNQADLNWFRDGRINQTLVQEFQKIVKFWTKRKVDGFRLDVPQALNKDFAKDTLSMNHLIFGDKDDQVINAIFPDKRSAPFLMMECFDPTQGELITHYVDETPVQFAMNVLTKEAVDKGELHFLQTAHHAEESYGFMLNTEDHDSPRFTSRGKLAPVDALWHLFNTQALAVCLYQGQELGLSNPYPMELPDSQLCELDAQTAMRAKKGEQISRLRPISRANARIPIPVNEYDWQMQTVSSCFNYTRELIARYHKL